MNSPVYIALNFKTYFSTASKSYTSTKLGINDKLEKTAYFGKPELI
jgi:hypothetical protein